MVESTIFLWDLLTEENFQALLSAMGGCELSRLKADQALYDPRRKLKFLGMNPRPNLVKKSHPYPGCSLRTTQLGGLVIVVSKPNEHQEIRGIADKPGVPISDRSTTLGGIGEIRAKIPDIPSRPFLRRALQNVRNEVGFGRSCNGNDLNVASFLNLTAFGDYFFDTEQVWFLPIIVQSSVSSSQFQMGLLRIPPGPMRETVGAAIGCPDCESSSMIFSRPHRDRKIDRSGIQGLFQGIPEHDWTTISPIRIFGER